MSDDDEAMAALIFSVRRAAHDAGVGPVDAATLATMAYNYLRFYGFDIVGAMTSREEPPPPTEPARRPSLRVVGGKDAT